MLPPPRTQRGDGEGTVGGVFVVCLRYAILCDTVINKPAPAGPVQASVSWYRGARPIPGPRESPKRCFRLPRAPAGRRGAAKPGGRRSRAGSAVQAAAPAATGDRPAAIATARPTEGCGGVGVAE